MATQVDRTILRGGSYEFDVTLLDEDAQPIDPSAMSLHYRVARRRNAAAVLTIEEPEITVVEVAPNWIATVPLATADTETLENGYWYHELYLIDAGERSVVMYGTLTLVNTQAALHT